MKKRILSALLAAMMTFTMVGCGETEDNGGGGGGGSTTRPTGTSITIYTGGSSEFIWTKGSKEEEILDYIEQKYFDETGVSLDFNVSFLGQDMKTKLQSALSGGDPVDVAVSHTRGGDGMDDWMIKYDGFYNLADDIEEYGPNVYDAFSKPLDGSISSALDAVTTSENKVVGIPSVISPYKFGILVRKDRMEAVGYTDDEEKAGTLCTATNSNYILVDNLEDFTAMCIAINRKFDKNYAVSGAIWDIEKALSLGAFGNSGQYTYAVDAENEMIRGGASFDYYLDVIKTEYDWAVNGVISKDADAILKEDAEQAFYSGASSVFVLDPTVTHLIQVARNCKAVNAEAEFTVLGALREKRDPAACKYFRKNADGTDKLDADGNKIPMKGFMRNTQATFCASVLKTSQNTVKIMKFLNWVYKNEANYNLCRYGREGIDWINNGDGTYSYPNESYATNPPYSGILTLVENQNMSNLIYKGYTEEELSWLATAADPDNYVENDVIDYLLPENSTMGAPVASAANNLRAGVLVPAWKGNTDPMTEGGKEFTSKANALKEATRTFGGMRYKAYLTMKKARQERAK